MKKKIYEVCVVQSFNALVWKDSGKWYIPGKEVEKRDTVSNFKEYILAETKEEAIKKYKDRYNWNNFDCVIDPHYGFWHAYPCLNEKNPEFEYKVKATEVHPTFKKLQKEMRADEFLEYCRQEMMPLEVVLCEKGED